MVEISNVKETDLLRRKGSNVSWIVFGVDEEVVFVYKNEGGPLSRMIKKESLRYWEKIK